MRAILSGTETIRRPVVYKTTPAGPPAPPPAPPQTDARLVRLLEKVTDQKPHDDPRVADLLARVAVLEQAVREASASLAKAAAQAETTEKLLRQFAERPNPEPPQITVSAPAPAQADDPWADLTIEVMRDELNMTKRLIVSRK